MCSVHYTPQYGSVTCTQTKSIRFVLKVVLEKKAPTISYIGYYNTVSWEYSNITKNRSSRATNTNKQTVYTGYGWCWWSEWGGYTFSDTLSWKTYMVLHPIFQESDRNSCAENKKKKKKEDDWWERSLNAGSSLTSAQLASRRSRPTWCWKGVWVSEASTT